LAPPDGLELFAARARAHGVELDGDPAAGELCERLDNLPLALELAAARTKLFPPAQLLERLGQRLDLFKGGRDADPRQRTLRATIEWSYELLSAEERLLFARLSVFAGGCTLAAAEAICDADADTLQSLLDKSLLRRAAERLWMLETIGEYAREALEASDELARIRARHADQVLQDAERGATDILGQVSAEWLERMDIEQDNVRAALAWFASVEMAESLARLAGAVWPWWFLRGYSSEGLRWLGKAREMRTSSHEPRVRVLRGISALAIHRVRDNEVSKSAASEAIELCREAGDAVGLGRALNALGLADFDAGDMREAHRLFEESVAVARTAGLRDALPSPLGNLGQIAVAERDFVRARKLCGEALQISLELGDTQGVMVSSYNIAEAHLGEGDLDEAEPLFAEVLRMAAVWGWQEGVLFPLEALAKVALGRGRPEKAALLLGAASELRRTLGQTDERVAPTTADAQAALGETQFEAAFDSGRRLSPDAALEAALAPLD
jgi:tetratricopeptide (TPR) repeat protein